MTQYLTIRHKIEIPVHKIIGTPSLTFLKWFPLENQDKLVVSRNEHEVVLWFDKSCLNGGQRNEDLSKHLNVLCGEIFADVTIKTYQRN